MKNHTLFYFLGSILLLHTACQSDSGHLSPDIHKEDWISLFNGKNLTGWTPKFAGYELGMKILF